MLSYSTLSGIRHNQLLQREHNGHVYIPCALNNNEDIESINYGSDTGIGVGFGKIRTNTISKYGVVSNAPLRFGSRCICRT